VVRDGDVHVTDAFYATRRRKWAKRTGDGTIITIRIEPEDEAYSYAEIKAYWGYTVTPFAEATGYHKNEVHAMLKAECMQEGKTSITELSREEFRAYREAADQKAREWCPDAFALLDLRSA
jgi:hypothetical protein